MSNGEEGRSGMAAGADFGHRETLQDLVIEMGNASDCQTCRLDKYDQETRVMSCCGHSLCSQCIQWMKDQAERNGRSDGQCPQCKKSTPRIHDPETMEKLPKNISLLNILDTTAKLSIYVAQSHHEVEEAEARSKQAIAEAQTRLDRAVKEANDKVENLEKEMAVLQRENVRLSHIYWEAVKQTGCAVSSEEAIKIAEERLLRIVRIEHQEQLDAELANVAQQIQEAKQVEEEICRENVAATVREMLVEEEKILIEMRSQIEPQYRLENERLRKENEKEKRFNRELQSSYQRHLNSYRHGSSLERLQKQQEIDKLKREISALQNRLRQFEEQRSITFYEEDHKQVEELSKKLKELELERSRFESMARHQADIARRKLIETEWRCERLEATSRQQNEEYIKKTDSVMANTQEVKRQLADKDATIRKLQRDNAEAKFELQHALEFQIRLIEASKDHIDQIIKRRFKRREDRCYYCLQSRHPADVCPQRRRGLGPTCENCHRIGHVQAQCRSAPTCLQCKGVGHLSYDCQNNPLDDAGAVFFARYQNELEKSRASLAAIQRYQQGSRIGEEVEGSLQGSSDGEGEEVVVYK